MALQNKQCDFCGVRPFSTNASSHIISKKAQETRRCLLGAVRGKATIADICSPRRIDLFHVSTVIADFSEGFKRTFWTCPKCYPNSDIRSFVDTVREPLFFARWISETNSFGRLTLTFSKNFKTRLEQKFLQALAHLGFSWINQNEARIDRMHQSLLGKTLDNSQELIRIAVNETDRLRSASVVLSVDDGETLWCLWPKRDCGYSLLLPVGKVRAPKGLREKDFQTFVLAQVKSSFRQYSIPTQSSSLPTIGPIPTLTTLAVAKIRERDDLAQVLKLFPPEIRDIVVPGLDRMFFWAERMDFAIQPIPRTLNHKSSARQKTRIRAWKSQIPSLFGVVDHRSRCFRVIGPEHFAENGRLIAILVSMENSSGELQYSVARRSHLDRWYIPSSRTWSRPIDTWIRSADKGDVNMLIFE